MTERFETFTVLINRINRNIKRIKNHEMADHNLKSAHISCLYYIYHNHGITATELCEKCEEDKATVSRALNYLKKNGFIIEQHDDNKKYKNPLVLTEKGKDTGLKISEKIDKILSEAGGKLTNKERIMFYRILTSISNELDIIAEHLFTTSFWKKQVI